jgi:8-oxo-dGTP diphosphatase
MNPIRNSAKAVIIQDNRILTIKLQDKDGFWYCLPGGGQQHGETLIEALKRECKEEINAEIEVGDIIFVRDYIGKNHEFADIPVHAEVHQVEFMFACRLADGAEVRLGSVPDTTQLDVEWLPLDQLDSYRLYPLTLRALISAQQPAPRPIYLGDIN